MPLELSDSQLFLGAQGDDVGRLHDTLRSLGKDIPVDEATNRVFGRGTAALVEAFQATLKLPATGILDAETVAALNRQVTAAPDQTRVLRGEVRNADGSPAAKLTVQAYLRSLAGDTAIGTASVNGDGTYEISYKLPSNTTRADLGVEVRNADGPVDTTPPSTSLLTNAGEVEVVDFVVSATARPPASEYARILAQVTPLIGTRTVAELNESSDNHEVGILAVQTGRPVSQIGALVMASRLSATSKVPAELLYGLLREGLPGDLNALRATHGDVQRAALASAVEKGTVSNTVDGRDVADYLDWLGPTADPSLTNLLRGVLEPADTRRLLQLLLQDQDPAAFWKAVAADSVLGNRAGKLKLAVQLANLVGPQPKLVSAVLSRPDVREASDLAGLTADEWTSLVKETAAAPAPTGDLGADEQTRAYVGAVMGRIEAAFPARVLAARLGEHPIASFLEGHPDYDLRTTYPPGFFAQNPDASNALNADDRQQLARLQRVYRLTGSADETLALVAKGTSSAQQIVRLSRSQFVASHADALDTDRANAVYDRALRVASTAIALYGENAAALNRTGMQALPRLDSGKMASMAANAQIPDWQSLFGSADSCACDDCGSVHGPAAYFVDVLHFLDDRGARATLFARRPDLGDIELSCENTNTPLPVVDLVNEILEDLVAPPSPFNSFTLSATLETDLAQPVATDALRAAFTPVLTSGARVEVMEPNTRWRIWDEPYAFSVVKDGGTLRVESRTRQTTGTAAERRATPQYRNSAAYDELARSVFPWSLPFDLPRDEARAFLGLVGVSRSDYVEALQPAPQPFDPNAPVVVRVASEGLGLSDLERQIIVGETLTPPRTPEDFWGSTQLADLVTVRSLLDHANLAYADLDALLVTRFVNPGRTAAITADPATADWCDTTQLQVAGLTTDVADRLHRFVRLWRKLGWNIWELDRAIAAFSPDPNVPTLTNELLVRLDHVRRVTAQLRLTVSQALALWRPIDTTEPGSLYKSLFYNPAVFKPQDDVFRLRPDGQELNETDKLLVDHAAALQAALRLSAAGFTTLLGRTDGTLNLANLSVLYRHSALAQRLRLSVQDLLTAVELTGIDPFAASHTEDTLRFIDAVGAIRSSGLDLARLDYILRHRFSTAAAFVPSDASLARTLTDLRDDLLKVSAESDSDLLTQRQSATTDRIAAAVGLSSDLTRRLLDRVTHGAETGLVRFIEVTTIDGDLARGNAAAQFETLEKLLKIAAVITVVRLPASQLDWLFRENPWLAKAPDPQLGAVSISDWGSLLDLQRLRQGGGFEDGAIEALLDALTAIANAGDAAASAAAKTSFADAAVTWLGWSRDDVQTLIGVLDNPGDLGLLAAQFPVDYDVGLVVRLDRAIRLTQKLGVPVARAAAWTGPSLSAADADAIRAAAKAKYDDDAWNATVVPLQDTLRDAQRAALAAYLTARPGDWSALTTATPDDLYEHVLVDVQMSPCQLTSRIKQAIGSVQLFAQRCLMGLEPGVQTDDPKWKQWGAWMKSFRVWEANRMVWLYPENWIDPELRDDKSPFFKELETELQQSDLDDAASEQALFHYLQKLDEVAHLEIAGTYQDPDSTVHAFGRTHHTPHLYYYRRRDATTQTWSPWEKVELDIEGDHLIPVVWNRRLMLIWPLFTEKQDQTTVTMPPPGGALDSGIRYWEIRLAWSELQSGRWAGKQVSDAVRFDARVGQSDILFGKRIPEPVIISPAIGLHAIAMAPVTTDPPPPPPPQQPPPPPPPGNGGSGSGGASSTNQVTSLVDPERMTFKAIVAGDTLVVRGLLRLDYQNEDTGLNAGVAFPFGEFRFLGCRKLISTAPRSQMLDLDFVLAPKNTKFEAMWFEQTGSGLTMLDGSFRVPHRIFPAGFVTFNDWSPLPLDPSRTIAERIDIPVLGATASTFRLLAPHQDPQFLANRPSFFMDAERSFVITSTGSSGFVTRPGSWVFGDVRNLGMAMFAPAPDNGTSPPPQPREFTVLVPAPGGRRVPQRVASIDLSPTTVMPRTISTFWSDRIYTFRNFHHPYLCEFVERLDRDGIDGLLALDTQNLGDPHSFDGYAPTSYVAQEYPIDNVEFQFGGSFDLYNWELFFHVPLLIATRLSANQRFDEAQRWFHFIFDPTGAAGGNVPQQYWRVKPFHDRLAASYEQESIDAIERLAATGPTSDLIAAVNVWRNNPFDPFAIARLRTTAFQKTVVMKYIDNLIAWGDQLFRRNTIESINEATQLYVLALAILGRRPELIERKVRPAPQTFNTLGQLGLLSNALEQIELLISSGGAVDSPGGAGDVPDPPKTLYFCVQENAKLVGYWDTVADRLLKIRSCMNIEGQVQQLPLFEPPIDPALLVRAQAMGLSAGDVLTDIAAGLPPYRYSVMLQKAQAVVAEVRNLGAALLSVLEKQDAEALALLRSSQELQLLQVTRDVRSQQVDEAARTLESLQQARIMAEAKKAYYEGREFTNALEKAGLALTAATLLHLGTKAAGDAISIPLSLIPDAKAGTPTTVGITFGGNQRASAASGQRSLLQTLSDIASVGATVTNTLASYQRRMDDWTLQASLATIELKQIDRQIAAAEIRLAIAEQELANHDQQIENARINDEFVRTKFTNRDLYQWMVGQLSGVYFQSYQLAYELAKKAERCFGFETGQQDSAYIQFGYWDSLKKGLLAGERLQFDLQRLDSAYLEQNRREYELTKSVSLQLLDPLAVLRLRETGRCFVKLPEEIFDLDYPGHYFRRMKAVSVTLPCVVGPFPTVSCTLRLSKNQIRINTADGDDGYRHNTDGNGVPTDDTRFVENEIPVAAIATSHGQNDSGLFELNFHDERYLPFEGAGAISEWSLELFTDVADDFGKPLRQFDYGTIVDVILHVRYTAREDSGAFKNGAIANLRNYFTAGPPTASLLGLDLRRDFGTQWSRFLHPTNPANGNVFELEVSGALFPMRDAGKSIAIETIQLFARCASANDYAATITLPSATDVPLILTRDASIGLHGGAADVSATGIEVSPVGPGSTWKIRVTPPGGTVLAEDPATQQPEVRDLYLVLTYKWST